MNDVKSPLFSILIVDDDAKNIQLLGNILKEQGYHVEFAMDGESTLEWVRSKTFDLILLDINMPEMDGYAVCKMIKENGMTQHIPVIFLTARVDTDSIVKGFDMGCSDYITKPFRTPELLARVKKEVELKVLRGLIPICAHCKAIRKDEKTWSNIEEYIQEHSFALFSHGLCPKCTEELYGHEDWYREENV